jgi:hypothetical protein
MPFGILVHEMRDHRIMLAVKRFLRGRMEMHLRQGVAVATTGERGSGGEIRLHSMAVM